MSWRFVEAATDEFANLLRRSFSYHEEFNNVGATGVFDLGLDDEGLVFDQFFQEYEQYPVITIAGQVGSFVDESGGGISAEFGQESIYQDVANIIDVTQYLTIGTTNNLTAGTSFESDQDLTLRTVGTYMRGLGDAGDVSVYFWKGDQRGPLELLASGSVGGFTSSEYEVKTTELYPWIDVQKNSYYWITYATDESSQYRIGINPNGIYKTAVGSGSAPVGGSQWVVDSGSIAATIKSAPWDIVGGAMQFSLLFSCMSKEASESRRLGDLTTLFLALSRKGTINRSATGDLKMDWGGLSPISKNGLAIQDVSIGAEQVQERGDDRIWVNSVTATIRGEWTVAFERELLKDVGLTVVSY